MSDFICLKSPSHPPSPSPSSDISTSDQSSINDSSLHKQTVSETVLWNEHYRVGTMYAFHLFHKQQFERAFVELNEFLTDSAEMISLFEPLSANTWLTNSFRDLHAFIKQL